jgi:hypothetical protein
LRLKSDGGGDGIPKTNGSIKETAELSDDTENRSTLKLIDRIGLSEGINGSSAYKYVRL